MKEEGGNFWEGRKKSETLFPRYILKGKKDLFPYPILSYGMESVGGKMCLPLDPPAPNAFKE